MQPLRNEKYNQPPEKQIGKEMLEEIFGKENMTKAFKKVLANKGACGVDAMGVEELQAHMNKHWSTIKTRLLEGKYIPNAVREVEIPKPNGGKRKLGIPTVTDRLIQQSIAQKLNQIYDKEFSEYSYGFRPGKSAHQAVRQAERYINEGNKFVVEIDLEKFFDKVNHDRLMQQLSRRIEDKRLLKLIRRYLTKGIMAEGVVNRRTEGTPQGSPLSPLLSNIVLDELDKELESRGHKFVRYADDCSVYLQSMKAATRVLESLTGFIEGKLKLKVNGEKSKVSPATKSNLLGFTFY